MSYLFLSPSISTRVARPKSPNLISILSLRNKLPNLRSRWMTCIWTTEVSHHNYNILLVPWLHVDKRQLILFVEINTVPRVLLMPSFFYVVPSKTKYVKLRPLHRVVLACYTIYCHYRSFHHKFKTFFRTLLWYVPCCYVICDM